MIELASRYGAGEPVRIRNIAENHGIPSRFLVQILLQLKGAGLVMSTRGASGGYQLQCDPGQITLAQVMNVIDGHRAEVTSNATLETPGSRVLNAVWQEVLNVEQKMLGEITFAELVERVRGETENMYYI